MARRIPVLRAIPCGFAHLGIERSSGVASMTHRVNHGSFAVIRSGASLAPGAGGSSASPSGAADRGVRAAPGSAGAGEDLDLDHDLDGDAVGPRAGASAGSRRSSGPRVPCALDCEGEAPPLCQLKKYAPLSGQPYWWGRLPPGCLSDIGFRSHSARWGLFTGLTEAEAKTKVHDWLWRHAPA